MNIWNLISRNFGQKAHTRPPQDSLPYPPAFRGDLLHDAALCTSCGTCAYVCSPGAIEVEHTNTVAADWVYQIMQCTFCGRCVEYCPTHALSFDPQPRQYVLRELSTLHHRIGYQPCPRCGDPVIPLPKATLMETYNGTVPAGLEQLNLLCARCRKKVYSEAIKRGFTGS